jgi:cellulose synthase/poly-beta-1,6-N-acetylglucosamine synthase-like glycosyltransferase
MITLFLIFYCTVVGLLMLYGINCHIMVYLFKRNLSNRVDEDREFLEDFYSKIDTPDLPIVTSQIPIFNELNVAERIIDAVAAFEYPNGKHEIQVLDDSTDETTQIIAGKVKKLKQSGVKIEHIRRSSREGFKAGALKYGLHIAKGDFLAIFDADFVPKRDFLLKTVPFFKMNSQLGLIQGRWGHLNRGESLLTRLQSIGINGHFIIEQAARSWNGLFMNFNGTAGIFRKQAILDAGNWQSDTLTEDMDLSYRIQLHGWECRYLIDVVAPAELPTDINAFKSQQFRWAKGSIQTAIKLLPRIWTSHFNFFKKIQATLHLTHYSIHPLIAFLAFMALPLLLTLRVELSPMVFTLIGCLLVIACIGPSRLYWNAEKYAQSKWTKRITLLPFLACFGCGLAINNSRAVLEAFLGKKSDFIRTPKKGVKEKKFYKVDKNFIFYLEILTGFWCLLGLISYFHAHQYLVGPFLLMYTIGFFYVGGLSILHQRKRSQ